MHRAPRSRDRLRDFQWFCLEHVREYNLGWNYFAGMSEAQIEAHRRADVTWHRPTWRMGTAFSPGSGTFNDPFGFYADAPPRRNRPADGPSGQATRMMAVMGLEPGFTPTELKRRYKALVKRYHPDLHGGDKRTEDQLRAVIEAYRYLRDSGPAASP